MGMLAEREKRFLRTVTGGRQAVGAEPYPGEKGNQGYMLAGLAAERVQRATKQSRADALHVGGCPDSDGARLDPSTGSAAVASGPPPG